MKHLSTVLLTFFVGYTSVSFAHKSSDKHEIIITTEDRKLVEKVIEQGKETDEVVESDTSDKPIDNPIVKKTIQSETAVETEVKTPEIIVKPNTDNNLETTADDKVIKVPETKTVDPIKEMSQETTKETAEDVKKTIQSETVVETEVKTPEIIVKPNTDNNLETTADDKVIKVPETKTVDSIKEVSQETTKETVEDVKKTIQSETVVETEVKTPEIIVKPNTDNNLETTADDKVIKVPETETVDPIKEKTEVKTQKVTTETKVNAMANTSDIKLFATMKTKPRIKLAHPKNPDQLLAESINRITEFLQDSGALELTDILYFVDQEISPYFDFHRMTTLSLGASAKRLTLTQLKTAKRKIKAIFIEKLANMLVKYSFTKRSIRFLPTKVNRFGTQALVRAFVKHPEGKSSRLLFKFHPTKKGWKIYDIVVNGYSAVVFYRKNIRKIISHSNTLF